MAIRLPLFVLRIMCWPCDFGSSGEASKRRCLSAPPLRHRVVDRMEPGKYLFSVFCSVITIFGQFSTSARPYAFLCVGALVFRPQNVTKHLVPGTACMTVLIAKQGVPKNHSEPSFPNDCHKGLSLVIKPQPACFRKTTYQPFVGCITRR